MIIEAGVVVVLAGIAYLERRALKADVVKAEAKVVGAGQKFLLSLRVKEAQIRAQIANDVAKVIADAKARAEGIETEAKHYVQEHIALVEADLKKVI